MIGSKRQLPGRISRILRRVLPRFAVPAVSMRFVTFNYPGQALMVGTGNRVLPFHSSSISDKRIFFMFSFLHLYIKSKVTGAIKSAPDACRQAGLARFLRPRDRRCSGKGFGQFGHH
jgi:hypothetical protein